MEIKAMKAATAEIFNYVKAHESENITAKDVADALKTTAASVNGSFTSFVKKGLGYREEQAVMGGTIKYLRMTDEGKSFEPVIESDEIAD